MSLTPVNFDFIVQTVPPELSQGSTKLVINALSDPQIVELPFTD